MKTMYCTQEDKGDQRVHRVWPVFRNPGIRMNMLLIQILLPAFIYYLLMGYFFGYWVQPILRAR